MQMLKIWDLRIQCWTVLDNGHESMCWHQSIQDMGFTMKLQIHEQKQTKIAEMSYKKRNWYVQRIK